MSEAMNVSFDDEPAAPLETPAEAPPPEPQATDEQPSVATQQPSDETPVPSNPDEMDGSEPPAEEPVKFDERQQAVMDKVIAKKTAKTREIERERDELLSEIQQLRSQVPQDVRPDIPDIPQLWEDDYEQKIAARDQAIKEQAAWDARDAYRQEQEAAKVQAAAMKEAEALHATVETYTQRGKDMGITEEALNAAGEMVAPGLGPQLAQYLLNDEMGAAITVKLANSPALLDEIRSAQPLRAAAIIETRVRPQIIKENKREAPPPPSENLKGSGAKPQERGPAGATYE